MKPLIAFFLLVIVYAQGIAQMPERVKHPQTKEDYLEKSKNQKLGGFILLGLGAAGIAAVAPGNTDMATAGTVGLLSSAAILGSVPLLLAAHRNKKKAKRLSAYNDLDRKLEAISNSYFPTNR